MTTTDDDQENANVVSIHANANRISVESKSLVPSFPKEWKAHGLVLLAVYKEDERERLGYKRYGWGKIRDAIMSEFDEVKSGKILERDSRLSRQDLEAWERGTELSDNKFLFIDRFIRKLDIDGKLNKTQKIVIHSKAKLNALSLQEMYQSNTLKGQDYAANLYTSGKSKYLMSSEIADTWFKQIIVRLDFVFGNVLSIRVAYLPNVADKLNPIIDPSEIVFYDGFIVPVVCSEEKGLLRERLFKHISLIKLYSSEFKGVKSIGYAEGELCFRTLSLMYPKTQSKSLEDAFAYLSVNPKIELDFPSPVLKPAHSPKDRGGKYFPIEAEEKSRLERHIKEQKGEIEEDEQDFFKEYRWKVSIKKCLNASLIRKFDLIFEEYYKGYSF